MSAFSIQEFKPTIFFLLKFVGFYLLGNSLYGFYITSFYPQPDPITALVSAQSAWVLKWLGWDVQAVESAFRPITALNYLETAILDIYEGCNGLNVMIIFVVFLFAFGPFQKAMFWFIPAGLVLLHVSNLLRIAFLFLVSLKLPQYFFLTHKYIFTASIYVVVFVLWMWWVKSYSKTWKGDE